jgi:hypothetical protein
MGLGRRLAAVLMVGLGCMMAAGTSRADTVPLPADAALSPQAAVNAIACPAAGACVAVGYYTDNKGVEQVLLLNQSNGSWSASEGNLSGLALGAGGISATHNALDPTTIACTSAGNCSVAGSYQDGTSNLGFHPFVMNETSGAWGGAKPVALPANSDTGYLQPRAFMSQLSCSSAGNCVVVGT